MLLRKNLTAILIGIASGVFCSGVSIFFMALLFGLNFKGMIAWIIAGLPFDMIHGVSNFFCGMLIVPIVYLLRHLEKGLNTGGV